MYAGLEVTRCRSEVVMEKALLRQQLIVLERGLAPHARADALS
jgi:hypothetical protein